FSSRRMHTISKRDWSSDVCSSDLGMVRLHQSTVTNLDLSPLDLSCRDTWPLVSQLFAVCSHSVRCRAQAAINYLISLCNALVHRSEERRVGKDCRYVW